MKTRCPHCDALYDIDEATLASTDYTAVCCQCHRVFSAEKLPQQEQPLRTAAETGEWEDAPENTEESTISAAETQPTGTAEPEATEEPETDDWDFVYQQETQEINHPAATLTSDVPDDFTSLAAAELPEKDLISPLPPKRKSSFLAFIGVVLLALAAATQFAWINKQQIMENPEGRRLFQQLCDYAGCELEQKSAMDKFSILHRDLQPAINHRQALNLTLSFRNQADFSQKLPSFQLSLLDDQQQPLAQRTFSPDEYLYPASALDRAMKPAEIVNVDLLFQDPKLPLAGFKLEFL